MFKNLALCFKSVRSEFIYVIMISIRKTTIFVNKCKFSTETFNRKIIEYRKKLQDCFHLTSAQLFTVLHSTDTQLYFSKKSG